ncbi:signal transduction histidine kinase [Parabacteroides sp. PFB2-12]|uniref:sensor histidine kinase n=1 Tax=unclassified Parabacteroides TaxID=2649774 RepID=UPI002475D8C7|nr:MULTISPECIES: GAF domain-containing sensor histidine kinase [unclassified Parabacteroides]MDH6341603.1 signal transduction histidine kinase [Parabacteroides sp. PM6-13]MDH6389974.1 signal transduction histidine kinase [Parabacteroides sp. PFB2-12]
MDIKQLFAEINLLLLQSDKKENMDKAMQIMLDYFDLDWIYVAFFDEENALVHCVYEMMREKEDAGLTSRPSLSFENMSWTMKNISAGNDLLVKNLEDIPTGEESDLHLMRSNGMKSFIATPLFFNDEVKGFIGLSSRRNRLGRTQEEFKDLPRIAHIFSIVLERYQQRISLERKEKELMDAQEANRLKSAFISNISHEIRTPLNAIVGFSSIIAETENLEERLYYQGIVDKNNDMLLQIIADMMDLSKMESGELDYEYTEVNLKQICLDIFRQFANQTAPDVSFLFHMEQHPDLILLTDENRVKQVIAHFVKNACKFTSAGSIVLSYRIVDNKVRVSVSDTGIGIAPEHHKDIFKHFKKLDSFSQGIGLGLSISKSIVESLDGEIGLNSLSGKGSTFWFTLPLKEKVITPLYPPQEEKRVISKCS